MSKGAEVMNAVTENWIHVGHVDDIPLRGARRVVRGDATIAVFRVADGSVYAIEDKCPHRGTPLSQGIVHDGCVACPMHNWVISLANGEVQGVDEGSVRTFRVKITEDADVLLAGEDLAALSA